MHSRVPASKLREARLKRGWSQETVGQKLGITGAAIGHYETGLSKPTADRAAQLAKILGLRSGDIQASARGEGGQQNGNRASGAGQKGGARSSRDIVADSREVAMMKALRAMPSAERRVVMEMVIAYGSAGRNRRR
jgi:transcriptional regulator with XRE-family HTH domain